MSAFATVAGKGLKGKFIARNDFRSVFFFFFILPLLMLTLEISLYISWKVFGSNADDIWAKSYGPNYTNLWAFILKNDSPFLTKHWRNFERRSFDCLTEKMLMKSTVNCDWNWWLLDNAVAWIFQLPIQICINFVLPKYWYSLLFQ